MSIDAGFDEARRRVKDTIDFELGLESTDPHKLYRERDFPIVTTDPTIENWLEKRGFWQFMGRPLVDVGMLRLEYHPLDRITEHVSHRGHERRLPAGHILELTVNSEGEDAWKPKMYLPDRSSPWLAVERPRKTPAGQVIFGSFPEEINLEDLDFADYVLTHLIMD
jgi:hypothetical protein